MNEDERKIAATLAAIAEQGGADLELDVVIFQEVVASVPKRILLSEAINSEQ